MTSIPFKCFKHTRHKCWFIWLFIIFAFWLCVLQSVIDRERKGDYLGKTVQVFLFYCTFLFLSVCCYICGMFFLLSFSWSVGCPSHNRRHSRVDRACGASTSWWKTGISWRLCDRIRRNHRYWITVILLLSSYVQFLHALRFLTTFLDTGDIESMPFIEALGQFSYRVGKRKIFNFKWNKYANPHSISWFLTVQFIYLKCFQELGTSAWFMSVSSQFWVLLVSRYRLMNLYSVCSLGDDWIYLCIFLNHKGKLHRCSLLQCFVCNAQKTKPTQHSVRGLRSLGLTPNLLACRSTMVCLSLF